MNNLKSGSSARRPLWRILRLLPALVACAAVILLAEKWRGQWALRSWKRAMATKGEVFDARTLWGTASTRSIEFSNRLAQVMAKPLGRLGTYAGQLSGIVTDESGAYRRGSQEPRPPFQSNGDSSNSWHDLDESLRNCQPLIESLRSLMKDPPANIPYDAVQSLENGSYPNFVAVRRAAQSLHAAAINELHNGNLDATAEDLAALASFSKLYENDPSLVNYMIRMAIVGLSVDAYWDALQAGDWTEPQLAALQRTGIDEQRLLAQMPRTLEAERLSRIQWMKRFRADTYEAWIARYEDIFISFGCKPPASDVAGPMRLSRQYLFHPVWSFAWADQEELDFLRCHQLELNALREAVQRRSLSKLNAQLDRLRLAYRTPAAGWRFYRRLPMVDTAFEVIGGGQSPAYPVYPYPDFSRAWSTTMRNLTLHEMVKTAIALRRYELRHGKCPPELAALVPDFLAGLPCDYMDGQPLRYRVNLDGSFTLYSVGTNMRDDGGSPSGEDSGRNSSGAPSAWSGKDWVWIRAGA